ncbi:hypothetical protein [Sinorhizobium meliloti]|uniref:hypothetical protein n=1 Tax=Rhizobium meliloti TaxID=382 RepID=UPI000FDC1BE3|nr:hypothetical protein [Sinorhizobium meliloti]RVN04082.1 hypothetical protein CN112_26125 [Sinorhizobium meliloti]
MAYVSVEVDVDDVIDALSDRELIAEYKSRGLDGKEEPGAREVVHRAVSLIKVGRVNDGVTLLEREFFPRYEDKAACEAAYQLAMALKVGAQ